MTIPRHLPTLAFRQTSPPNTICFPKYKNVLIKRLQHEELEVPPLELGVQQESLNCVAPQTFYLQRSLAFVDDFIVRELVIFTQATPGGRKKTSLVLWVIPPCPEFEFRSAK